MTEYEQGIPSWVDLSAADIEAAKEFYTTLFGWEYLVGPPELGDYTQALLGGRTVAGLAKAHGDAEIAWTTYLAATDADVVANAVTKHGGRLITDVMDVMGEGRMLIAVDPTGAAFGAWEPGRHRGAQLVNKPGSLVWNELATVDAVRAREFYAEVFGVAIGEQMEGFDYTTFKVGGRDVGGIFTEPEATPRWDVYFAVSDTDETVRLAADNGAAVLIQPHDSPYGRMARIKDPQGAVFSLMSVS